MRLNHVLIGAAVILVAGCTGSQTGDNQAANTGNEASPRAGVENHAMGNATAPASATDSNSSAAAMVVKDYAALAEKGSFAEAARYWSNATAAAQFAASLEDYPKVKLTAGKPTDEEGAAGSIYINVPLILDLTLRSGSPYQMVCKTTLRRVNDVPGSSQEQRRWHIETIDC